MVLIAALNISAGLRTGGNKPYSKDWKNYFSCADWIRHNTPENTLVMCRKQRLFYLRGLRKTVVYPYSHNVENIYKFIDEKNVDYVLYDGFFWTKTSIKYLYPAIISNPHKFEIVYHLPDPDTYVLKVRRPE